MITKHYMGLPAAGVLPAPARAMLVKASQIKDEKERARAIDEATAKIKQQYPHYFK